MWSPKSVNKIFPSQRNTNQNFWLPDGKFWSPTFSLRIRTKRTRLGPQWRYIHLRLKNYDERIECRLYTQFHKTAKCFKSTLYLLLSLPFGEEMYQIENCHLVLCSMFKTIFPFAFCQDDRPIAILLAQGHNRAAFLVEKKEGGEASHCLSCETL